MRSAQDTNPQMHWKQIESLRRLTASERLAMAFQLSDLVWDLARQAFAERFADVSADEQQFRFLVAQYGRDVAGRWWKAKVGQEHP